MHILKMHAEKVVQIYGQKGWRSPTQSSNVKNGIVSFSYIHSKMAIHTVTLIPHCLVYYFIVQIPALH